MLRIQFPWYNFAFLQDDYVNLWGALSTRLRDLGWNDLPGELDPSTNLEEVLASPNLLCSRTCGYDLAIAAPVPLTVLLTPTFAAPGCGPGTYRSFVVVRRSRPQTRSTICMAPASPPTTIGPGQVITASATITQHLAESTSQAVTSQASRVFEPTRLTSPQSTA
jgi:hypothetical protein